MLCRVLLRHNYGYTNRYIINIKYIYTQCIKKKIKEKKEISTHVTPGAKLYKLPRGRVEFPGDFDVIA